MIDTIDISGQWVAALDPEDRGLTEQWWRSLPHGGLHARLPGTTETNCFGEEVAVGTPHYFTRKYPYAGAAWWWRWVDIPTSWEDQIVELHFERCLWTSQVWFGSTLLGQRDSLTTPHRYRCPVKPGRQLLAVRTDNRGTTAHMGLAWNPDSLASHAYSDHTQTRWNGLVGDMHLTARPAIAVRHHRWQLTENLNTIELHLSLHNDHGSREEIDLDIQLEEHQHQHHVQLNGSPAHELIVTMPRNELPLWDDLSPTLHDASIVLRSAFGEHRVCERIGLRSLSAREGALWINGRPLFLRGTLECAIWPQTGHPPTDVSEWTRVMRVLRAHGLNHLRFHSWCPPKAAFLAADAAGILLQAEAPLWTGIGTWDDTRRYLWDETQRILHSYANHPSLICLAHGNEPGGHDHELVLHDWLQYAKALDPSRLYTCAASWPALPENDFHLLMTAQANGKHEGVDLPMRTQVWNQNRAGSLVQNDGTLLNFSDAVAMRRELDGGKAIPIISHEVGQWCAYPDLALIEQLHGPLRADNYQAIRDDAEQAGLVDLTAAFTQASGRLQDICYKAEMEAVFATPGMAGFQLLGLQDFPGQGTAPVGMVDVLWNNKGAHTAERFAESCGPLVPLARFAHHCHAVGATVPVEILVANYCGRDLSQVAIRWELRAEERLVRQGELQVADLCQGSGLPCGRIDVDLSGIAAGSAMNLHVHIIHDGALRTHNQWPWWVMTDQVDRRLRVVTEISDDIRNQVRQGATVLYCPAPERLTGCDTAFPPIFWNSMWTNGQFPYHLGLLIDHEHPALARFPTENWCNWQWHDLLRGRRAIDLGGQPEQEPIVRVIDDWNHHRHLALLTHEKIGTGHLLTCAMDLTTNLTTRPAARQMLHALASWAETNA